MPYFPPVGYARKLSYIFPPVPCGHNSVIQRSVVRIDTASMAVVHDVVYTDTGSNCVN